MKIIKIHVPLYLAEVTYLFYCTPEETHAYLQKEHGQNYQTTSHNEVPEPGKMDDDTDGLQFHVPGYMGKHEVFYVWIAEPDLNVLWHETLHLTFDILIQRGVEYAPSCEDAFAYLGGYIFDEVSKKLGITIKKA